MYICINRFQLTPSWQKPWRAALNAVLFSKEVGHFLDVTLECDALQVVRGINSDTPFLKCWIDHFIESIHLELGFLRSSCFYN